MSAFGYIVGPARPAVGRFPYRDHRTVAEIDQSRNEVWVNPDPLAALRVERTPCPRCGVRADIGCQHSRSLAA